MENEKKFFENKEITIQADAKLEEVVAKSVVRRLKKTKTYVNNKGFLVTEDVWV